MILHAFIYMYNALLLFIRGYKISLMKIYFLNKSTIYIKKYPLQRFSIIPLTSRLVIDKFKSILNYFNSNSTAIITHSKLTFHRA